MDDCEMDVELGNMELPTSQEVFKFFLFLYGVPIQRFYCTVNALQIKTEWERSPPVNCTPGKDDIIFQQLTVDDIVGKNDWS